MASLDFSFFKEGPLPVLNSASPHDANNTIVINTFSRSNFFKTVPSRTVYCCEIMVLEDFSGVERKCLIWAKKLLQINGIKKTEGDTRHKQGRIDSPK